MDNKMKQRLLEVRGIQAFETKDDFYRWFNMPSMALGDKLPADLAKTPEGVQQVLDELTRIEHGVY